jgi:Arc-like DNA binding domain
MARARKVTANLRLRLPEALRSQLASEAERANRSLNSEILWRLGQTLGEDWQRFIAGMEEREEREQEFIQRAIQSPAMKKVLEELYARLPKGAKPEGSKEK